MRLSPRRQLCGLRGTGPVWHNPRPVVDPPLEPVSMGRSLSGVLGLWVQSNGPQIFVSHFSLFRVIEDSLGACIRGDITMASEVEEPAQLEVPESPFKGRPPDSVAYSTRLGRMFHGKSDEILASGTLARYEDRVNLVFTSPPFPLNRKKKYGNETGDEYIQWLVAFGPLLKKMLTPDGSIVIEMGNSWESGAPVMSTLAIKTLIEFQEKNELHLCQEFIWHNPARLPSPAQWVNVERIRVKDSFTKLWWLSPVEKPKASNRRVLQEYSPAMKELLRTRTYNAGKRPSEHQIGEESFLTDNGGSIPPNVLTFANTQASDDYQNYCRAEEIQPHPARMPIDLAKFFIRFLTEPGDLVLDPFGGSNTTGAAAETLNRYWISIEASEEYIRGSRGRFQGKII
jgi:DNA modification methylase